MNNRSNIMVLQGQFEKLNNVHYEIDIREQTLGEGGTGIVRHGVMVDENSGIRRDVAIKFLYNDLSENAIQRSRREAEIHIVHENLIEMLGFVQIGEMDLYGKGNVHYHVVSELLNGVMLLDMLNEKVQPYVYSQYPKIKSYHDELMNNRYSFA
ncbi:MAG: protein kinase, partial [Clostridia bacterium]|nr:protein kinase [Clostridia bacterium]